MTDRFVPVEGAELHVAIEGTGRPVLVPTGGGIEFYRRTFSPALQERLQFVYIEMRGTGESTGSIEGATFASLGGDVEAVRAALGLERVAVLGHSNHGCIALEYGLRYPGATTGAVSVASVPDFRTAFEAGQARWEREATEEGRAALARLQSEFAAIDAARLTADEVMFRRYLSLAPLGWRDPPFDSRPLWGGPPKGMADYFGWLFAFSPGWNLVPRLPEIEVPVLALSGRYDYLCPVEFWESAINGLARGHLHVFEASAHNPQYEEAAQFDAVLLNWLAGLWD